MRYESLYCVPPQGRSCHRRLFFLKAASPNTPFSKTECSFFMRWFLKTRSRSQTLTHFHWHAKEFFLRHIPSRQIVPSKIIAVMQLFLPNKPTFVNSQDAVGSALWLQGWVKIQIMSTGTGVSMQQTLLFPENIWLLSLPLDVSSYTSLLCYVPLKFELLKSLPSYWTFCYLHHGGFPFRKTAHSSLDRIPSYQPACPGCCLPTICFLRWKLVTNCFLTSSLSSNTQEAGEAQI